MGRSLTARVERLPAPYHTLIQESSSSSNDLYPVKGLLAGDVASNACVLGRLVASNCFYHW